MLGRVARRSSWPWPELPDCRGIREGPKGEVRMEQTKTRQYFRPSGDGNGTEHACLMDACTLHMYIDMYMVTYIQRHGLCRATCRLQACAYVCFFAEDAPLNPERHDDKLCCQLPPSQKPEARLDPDLPLWRRARRVVLLLSWKPALHSPY